MATRRIDARWSRLGRSGASSILPPLVLIGLLLLVWEAFKFVGGAPVVLQLPWAKEPVTWDPPLRIALVSDLNLPHVWDIAFALAAPAQRAGPPPWQDLFVAGLFTLRSAALGFAVGAGAGLLIAVVLVRSRVLERAFAPYLVVSQTIPIVAIAPMIVIWLRAGWVSVAVISVVRRLTWRARRGPRCLRRALPRPAAVPERAGPRDGRRHHRGIRGPAGHHPVLGSWLRIGRRLERDRTRRCRSGAPARAHRELLRGAHAGEGRCLPG